MNHRDTKDHACTFKFDLAVSHENIEEESDFEKSEEVGAGT